MSIVQIEKQRYSKAMWPCLHLCPASSQQSCAGDNSILQTGKPRLGKIKQIVSSFRENTTQRWDSKHRYDFQTHGLPPKQRSGVTQSSSSGDRYTVF